MLHPMLKNRKGVPQEDIAATLVGMRTQRYSGPIPPAAELEKYKDVLGNAPDRILKMAEENSVHRRLLEKIELEAEVETVKASIKMESRNTIVGLLSAFLLCAATIVCGTFLIYSGKELSGGILSLSGLGSIVGTFIYGSKSQSTLPSQSQDSNPSTSTIGD